MLFVVVHQLSAWSSSHDRKTLGIIKSTCQLGKGGMVRRLNNCLKAIK